jgi:hypothetical protein
MGAGGGRGDLAAEARLDRRRRPAVVETDVEAGGRLPRYDVERGVADIDAGDL